MPKTVKTGVQVVVAYKRPTGYMTDAQRDAEAKQIAEELEWLFEQEPPDGDSMGHSYKAGVFTELEAHVEDIMEQQCKTCGKPWEATTDGETDVVYCAFCGQEEL